MSTSVGEIISRFSNTLTVKLCIELITTGQFPYTDTFNHEGPVVINSIHNLTVRVFENLEIISPTDVDKRLAYMQRILRGPSIKKYREILVTCKQSAKELAGDEWTLGDLGGVSIEDFWTGEKSDTIGYDGHAYLGINKCVEFERELWFDVEKCMWRKNQSVYQDHMKYVRNDIVKPFKVKTLRYAKRVREIHELAKYLPTPLMKG